MDQIGKDIRRRIERFEDEIYASRARYDRLEDEEHELESHNAAFHEAIDLLIEGEQDEGMRRRIHDSLLELGGDYTKAKASLYEMKNKEIEKQRLLSYQIDDCHIELEKERGVQSGE